jgi:hypothetical protein
MEMRGGSGNGTLLCLWHCFDPYAKGYCWMFLHQQWWQHDNKQLKAKSCSGWSSNDSGRGNGGCGTCGGGNNITMAVTTAMTTETVTAANNNSNSNSNSRSGGNDDNGGGGDSNSRKKTMN